MKDSGNNSKAKLNYSCRSTSFGRLFKNAIELFRQELDNTTNVKYNPRPRGRIAQWKRNPLDRFGSK